MESVALLSMMQGIEFLGKVVLARKEQTICELEL